MKDLQSFIDKHGSYYLAAIGNTICLEIDCKKRNKYVTEEEIEDLKSLGFVNVLSESDYTKMCCGIASFTNEAKKFVGFADYILKNFDMMGGKSGWLWNNHIGRSSAEVYDMYEHRDMNHDDYWALKEKQKRQG